MPNKNIEKVNVLAIKDDQGRIVGLISKDGVQTIFYKVEVAGIDDIEELLKSLAK